MPDRHELFFDSTALSDSDQTRDEEGGGGGFSQLSTWLFSCCCCFACLIWGLGCMYGQQGHQPRPAAVFCRVPPHACHRMYAASCPMRRRASRHCCCCCCCCVLCGLCGVCVSVCWTAHVPSFLFSASRGDTTAIGESYVVSLVSPLGAEGTRGKEGWWWWSTWCMTTWRRRRRRDKLRWLSSSSLLLRICANADFVDI
ncbi:hypothetical protein QBC47DRAFT_218010 [Echria macrotheca]|uniref:Uncharacterized protein n=1 Tax=Echria macrotheca TaxID=438768 RepID=A0AAJ0F5D8_9PEZI|nr:hypothetical protein QBC47DRAFT_218010 [Echria macrotheca]